MSRHGCQRDAGDRRTRKREVGAYGYRVVCVDAAPGCDRRWHARAFGMDNGERCSRTRSYHLFPACSSFLVALQLDSDSSIIIENGRIHIDARL